jgi:hypothetical protein
MNLSFRKANGGPLRFYFSEHILASLEKGGLSYKQNSLKEKCQLTNKMIPTLLSIALKCFSGNTGSIGSLVRLFFNASPNEIGPLWNCSNVERVDDLKIY